MNEEYISLKVVSYALCDFLYALLNNGVSEYNIYITKEDDYLVVRLPKQSLSSVRYKKENCIKDCNCVCEGGEQQ